IFLGDTIANNFTQPAALPSYQIAAIDHLNATHPGTRVLAIPGNDFAADRWGDTVDTPQPALLTRDFITREQQILGSIATADTLYATDGPLHNRPANQRVAGADRHLQRGRAAAPAAGRVRLRCRRHGGRRHRAQQSRRSRA